MRNGKKRILVVDDDRFVREGLKELLAIRGYETDTAEDGFDALKKLESEEFDLILLDLILPGMNGVETLKRILEGDPEANVVAMTAYSENDVMAMAIAEGARNCFTKPIDTVLLESMLREVVTA